MTRELAVKAEKALTHALGASLGLKLKPKFHRGEEDPADVEAIATLMELRSFLGIK